MLTCLQARSSSVYRLQAGDISLTLKNPTLELARPCTASAEPVHRMWAARGVQQSHLQLLGEAATLSMVFCILGLQQALHPGKVVPIHSPAVPHSILGICEFNPLGLPAFNAGLERFPLYAFQFVVARTLDVIRNRELPYNHSLHVTGETSQMQACTFTPAK